MNALCLNKFLIRSVLLVPLLTACAMVDTKAPDAYPQAEERAVLAALEEQRVNQGLLAEQVNEIARGQAQLDILLNSLVLSVAELKSQSQNTAAQAQPQLPTVLHKPVELVSADKPVLGRVEWLWLPSAERYFAAQLDTALDVSLIYADDISHFERNGEPWLRFTLLRNDWQSEIQARDLGHEKQRYLGAGVPMKGNVVSVPVELAGRKESIKFLVLNRKKDYPQVVLGKNFLTDVAIVDVAQKYTRERVNKYLQLESRREQENRNTHSAIAPNEAQ